MRIIKTLARHLVMWSIAVTLAIGTLVAPEVHSRYVDNIATFSAVMVEGVSGGQGSGVILGVRGAKAGGCELLVGTARHVLTSDPDSKKAERHLQIAGESGAKSVAAVWSADNDIGLAEFYTDKPCATLPYLPAPVADRAPGVGDRVYGTGWPFHLRVSGWGKVLETSLVRFAAFGSDIFTVGYSAAPGHSGGPGYNVYGEVTGILVGGSQEFQYVCLWVPAYHFRGLIRDGFRSWNL